MVDAKALVLIELIGFTTYVVDCEVLVDFSRDLAIINPAHLLVVAN
jgi:hypothetical protein